MEMRLEMQADYWNIGYFILASIYKIVNTKNSPELSPGCYSRKQIIF